MSIEVKVPVLPESVAEATIVAWHKKVGDSIRRDENLVDIETDKVILEVPSPVDGVLERISFDVDSVVNANQVIGLIKEGAVAEAAYNAASSPQALCDEPELSPAVRKILADNLLDAASLHGKIQGSGRDGRWLKKDIENYLANAKASPQPAAEDIGTTAPTPSALALNLPNNPLLKLSPEDDRLQKRVAMTGIRQKIAARAVLAQQQTATVTIFNEIDTSLVLDLCARYQDLFRQQHQSDLGYLAFFIKASVEALKRYPALNASIDGDEVIYHGFIDIGITLNSSRGQLIPVLRNVEHMNMADIEHAIHDFGSQIEDGSIDFADLDGGTFTITNSAVIGAALSTPVINLPQSACLGLHQIEKRPVVVDDAIVIRPMMSTALSYDQRLIDDQEAVAYLRLIKDLIEQPARMMLNI